MHLILKNLGKLFKQAFKEWANRDPFRLSAIIAYYAIFAIPGLLFLIINITGNIFGKDAVIQNILNEVSSTMSAETATQIEDIFLKVGQPKLTFMGSIIGIIGTLVIGYGVGVFWIIIRLTGASDFPLAPIMMSISMIIGTILIGFAFIKLVRILITLARRINVGVK